LPQLFLLKTPQYTKYSGVFKTEFGSKSLTQIIKKAFLEVAMNMTLGGTVVRCLSGAISFLLPKISQKVRLRLQNLCAIIEKNTKMRRCYV